MSPDMQKIVITGVSSFVGCHLAHSFSAKGWIIKNMGQQKPDNYPEQQAKRINYAGNDDNWVTLNLTDESSLKTFINKFQPDVWVHHAGYATNYGSMDFNFNKGHETNVLPLRALYESLSHNQCRGVIITGSSMEYSDTEQACVESDLCSPTTPYGLSKLTETLMATQLSARFNLPTRIARLFIPFGPLDNPQKLLYYVADKLTQGKAVDLSPCTQKRDFVYIDNLVNAYHLLVDDLARGGADIFNICGGKATAICDIVEWTAEILGASKDLLNFSARSMREGEQMISFGSNAKAREILQWEPGDIKEGITCMINQLKEKH